MGLIKAAGQAIKNEFADQWLEVFEPYNMGDQTVFAPGIKTRKGENVKGTNNLVSNSSMIRVYDNQFMMLVDGGKVVDYTTEPGYYTVNNSSAPSLFTGNLADSLGAAIKDVFERIKFGGETPREQRVYYINLQEIKGIKFGTRNPINYFDNFYNAELFIRAHGTYSVKIVNPLQFYAEAIPRNDDYVQISEINEQYISEFLQALQTSINQMSADGTRISHVTSKAMELGKYMATVLDEDWNKMRGIEIQAVGIASVSYDEKSQTIINKRNEAAVYADPDVARGHLVGSIGEAMKSAGANEAGALHGILGMGMSMNMGENILGQMPASTKKQQNFHNTTVFTEVGNAANTWTCECGQKNTGKFCAECGKKAPEPVVGWTCECGNQNTGKFCTECGKPAPSMDWTCECGQVNTGKFCSECGKPRA